MKNRPLKKMWALFRKDGLYAGIVALILSLFSSCNAGDSITDIPQEGFPIDFSTKVEGKQTRRDALTTANLLSTGILAYYTGSNDWTKAATPNFMYNQSVRRSNNTSPWTYSPVKYWPNNEKEKISFFAYAPYNAVGVTPSGNTVAGFPYLNYTVPTAEADQIDLLVATPLMNCTKNTGSVSLTMKHALTKVTIYVKSNDLSAGKVVNSLSVTGPKSGTLTYKADGFDWSTSTDNSTYDATKTDVSISTSTAEKTVLLGTFYLLPDRAKSSLNITYTLTGAIEGDLNPPTDKQVITGHAFPDTYEWTPGTSIVYTVNIARTGLEVVAESTSMEWTNGTTNEIELYDPAQLKLGDYYYDDGSWSDGGLAGIDMKTNVRIWKSPLPSPNLTNPETTSIRKCIGVVFAVEGDDVITNPTNVKAMVVSPKDEKRSQCIPSLDATIANFPPPGGVLSSAWFHPDEKTLRWIAKGDGVTSIYLREILDEHLIQIAGGAKLAGEYWVSPFTASNVIRKTMNLSTGSFYDINYLQSNVGFRGVLNVLK